MPNTARPPIRFYFDYLSPNAYLAWTRLPTVAERHGFALAPVPVLFAGLLEAHGQLGPAEVPPKMHWMSRSNLRKAALLGVGLNPPAFHPFNPLLALRVSSLPLEAGKRRALIDALFQAVWVRGLHVSEPAVVEQLAGEIGLDGAALVAEAQLAECKARLRAATDEAIARGVFGVPTMAVGDELFWGYDDLPHLELFLAGRDPLDPTRWQEWAVASRPSAVRGGPSPRPRPAGASKGARSSKEARVEVREIADGDPARIVDAFAGTPWNRGLAYFEKQLAEHRRGARVVLIGTAEGVVAGHGSLVWQSAYPPFRDRAIPEVQDLAVAPPFRRRGIASSILAEAERLASRRSRTVGIGFGLHPGYRAAQRLYGLRGYVPDGNGIFRAGRFPQEGEQVTLDDELVLYLTKDVS